MIPNAPHWASLAGRQSPAARRFYPVTPTGLSTADSDGGCEGQAASDVNAGRSLGLTLVLEKLVNVVIFPTAADRARTIPRPFSAPFKFMPFHDCEVARARR